MSKTPEDTIMIPDTCSRITFLHRAGITIALVLVAALLLVPPVSAHCPLCTAGAAAGVGIARILGVDDSIVGLLLGAFIAASALWIDRLLKARGIGYPLQGFLLVLASFLSMAVPLYYTGIITDTAAVRSLPGYHAVFGMEALGLDKLFSGMIVGTILVTAVFTASDYITARRRGKRLFRYQGMVLMAVAVAAFVVLFWALTR